MGRWRGGEGSVCVGGEGEILRRRRWVFIFVDNDNNCSQNCLTIYLGL